MRGKAVRSGGGVCLSGITPAYAGKSDTGPGSSGIKWDHPRICGEKRKTV